jgi:uncharacterized protein (DUF488 family)
MERKEGFPTVYTIGSSDRSWTDFVSLLARYGIDLVIDVRRFPRSRLVHFVRHNLEEKLREAGVEYSYRGKDLGGYRRGGYPAYMTTACFREGISALLKLVAGRKACLLCAERLPWRCHRRFIAEALAAHGVETIHILDRERVWKQVYGAPREEPLRLERGYNWGA